jgi:ribose transport system ATP-binding protein
VAADIVLEVKNIEKSFGPTKALKGVSFELRAGEVHAIVGENGAGKSTLMNIIDGVLTPDAGEIYIEGKKVEIKSPHEAHSLGIGFVHQEIALCPHVSAAENVFMSEINNSRKFVMNYNKLYQRAKEILRPLANFDPEKKVSELSISNQQVVEIAKALSMNCKIMIFDEPTSALTESETEALFKIMRELKEKGIGIIYISHRMPEIFSQCDRVTILRDGTYIATKTIQETDPKSIVNMMVGREISDLYPEKKAVCEEKTDDVIFEIKNFSDGKRFHNISFKVRQGEILGLAGLVGAGRSETAQAICGLNPKISGEVYYKGKKVKIDSSQDSIDNGIVYLTEDRKALGLFLELSIKANISAMKLDNISRRGLVVNKLESEQGVKYAKEIGIKCASIDRNVSSLSGGNQQKILIAKLLTTKPRVIFMDEPTRGIDVGAKHEIHKLIRQLSNQGTAIVFISSELSEVIGMCDRVEVMHEGIIRGEVCGEEINEKRIIQLASGL